MTRPPHRIPPLGPPRKTAQQRVLAQWRGVDLKPLEDIRGRPAQSAQILVAQVLHEKLRINQRQAEAEVLQVWNKLIDPTVVAHAQPTGLHKATLFVSVDSNVWLSEIVRYRRREILERLQHSFGREVIAKISFRVG